MLVSLCLGKLISSSFVPGSGSLSWTYGSANCVSWMKHRPHRMCFICSLRQLHQKMCKELGQDETVSRAGQGILHCEDDEEVTIHGGCLRLGHKFAEVIWLISSHITCGVSTEIIKVTPKMKSVPQSPLKLLDQRWQQSREAGMVLN